MLAASAVILFVRLIANDDTSAMIPSYHIIDLRQGVLWTVDHRFH